jgi:alkylation response protein AidB-like acyl-CoA dehydrogenase
MDLLPSSDQEQILDTLRSFLADNAPVDRLREHGAIGNPDAALWPELGQLGFIGLGLPEQQGGVGLGAAEEMLAFREFGRHLISPVVLALILAARVANADDLRQAILSGIATIGLANPRGGPAGAGGSYHLFEALEVDHILLIEDERVGLIPRSAFADFELVNSTDAVLSLERATLLPDAPGALWASDGTALASRARLLLGAYAVGVAEGARDMGVEYAKVREQFGKPIGSFQAVKHLCAGMAIRSEAALCQASFAALVMDQDHKDTDYHATSAKIVATDAALKNAADNIQVLGAFGFTSEANAHLFLKRAHVTDLLWGDLKSQRERLIAMPTAD